MRGLAALALVLASACAIRDARTSGAATGQPCSTNDQCDSSVCFLGECRNPSSSLALVHAEVRSSDPRYGTLQSTGIDMRKTAVADFTLQPVLTVSGRVMQQADPPGTGSTPVPGATVVFTDLAPAIPDRVLSTSAQSDSNPATAGTYSVRLPASTYDVLVASSSNPVVHPDGPVAVSNPSLNLVLPSKASIAHVHGVLRVGAVPLAGAQVSAADSSGASIAVAQSSAADGSFTLDLPPGPPAFSLQVGPSSSPLPNDPIPSFDPRPFAAGHLPDLGTIDLGALPAPATFTGKVVDVRGAPIASARVAVLSSGAAGYVISRETTTLADGSFSLGIRAGTYLVEAAPDADPAQPAVSDAISAPIVAPATNLADAIVCPDKVKVTGVLQRPDGRRATAGFQVDASRSSDQLVTGRGTRTASTDATGAFALVLDRGHYRIEIFPTPESGLPRTILSVDVPGSAGTVALPALSIAPPHELVGTVRAGNAVAGASIDFYAIDSSGKHSVLIGSAVADDSGRYSTVLPDVAQFAAQ